MSAMDHIHHLSVRIGPRGSTTRQETEAAEYAASVLTAAGLESTTEPFVSARSAWYPSALFCALALGGELLFWLAPGRGAAGALILTVAAVVSVLLELAFRPNPLRWLLPTGLSQNTWARISPSDEVRERVVLLGHLDSHRTPVAFSTERWLEIFGLLVPAGLVCSLVLAVIFGVGTFALTPTLKWISLPFALVLFAVLCVTLQADLTPYTAGANDNASGAAVVLDLAMRLKAQPLAHTAVWAVLSGCEEVGCYGAAAFARGHIGELGRPAWITLDTVGGSGAGPAYLTRETFLLTAKSDPELLELAERVATRHPEFDAYAHSFKGAYTEGAIGAKHGFRILTLVDHRRDGVLPEWHRPTDVIENVDPGTVERTELFVWELLQELDREAARSDEVGQA
jgi:hypothetical protein